MVAKNPTHMLFNLDHLLSHTTDLPALVEPLTTNEIDAVVGSLPLDKSQVLMGVTQTSLKNVGTRYFMIFMLYVRLFMKGTSTFKVLMVLILLLCPRKIHQCTRLTIPISLFNSSVKLITKLLASGLQKLIDTVVHRKVSFTQEQYNINKNL